MIFADWSHIGALNWPPSRAASCVTLGTVRRPGRLGRSTMNPQVSLWTPCFSTKCVKYKTQDMEAV